MKQLLSDYDRKGLDHDEQTVMGTLRALGFVGTEDMKAASRKIAAVLKSDNEFNAIVADFKD